MTEPATLDRQIEIEHTLLSRCLRRRDAAQKAAREKMQAAFDAECREIDLACAAEQREIRQRKRANLLSEDDLR